VYYLAGKIWRGLKLPRKTHAQKDAAQAGEFQRTLCERLASLNVAGGKPVRVWVADEHRYGLIPVVRKCWTLRGVRPTGQDRTKYEWGYLYSALEVDGQNAAEFLCLPDVSLEMSGLFLQHLVASDPDAEHIVIWDQAGFHPNPELHCVPARVHLVSLPPYSPELNPTEAIGDVINDRIGNVLWETIPDLEQAISEELRPPCEEAECVRRLVFHPSLIEQVNATATNNSAITCSKRYNVLKLNMKTAGDWLKVKRMEKNLTLGHVAAKMGIAISLVCSWESNTRVPDSQQLKCWRRFWDSMPKII